MLKLGDGLTENRNVRFEATIVLSQHFVTVWLDPSATEAALILKCIYYRIIRPVCEADQTTSPVQTKQSQLGMNGIRRGAGLCTDGLRRQI